MSGGFFIHQQYKIREISDELEYLIRNNNVPDEYGYTRNFPETIIEEFKKGLTILRQAEVYAHRIDYLASGDDGEESFIKYLKEDLEKLE